LININHFPLWVAKEIALEPRKLPDACEIFRLISRKQNRDHLERWLSWVCDIKTLADQEKLVRESIRAFAEGKGLPLNIRCGKELIGGIGLHSIDWSQGTAEIAYWLAKPSEGQGIATSACKRLIEYAFSGAVGLRELHIQCHPENARSRGVPQRLGFSYQGMVGRYSIYPVRGNYVRQELYAIQNS